MIAVILPVAGSARASPDGVSTHTAFSPGTICGVYPPLLTPRLATGLSESWLIKMMRLTPAQPIQMPRGPGDAAHAGPVPGIGAAFTITSRDGSILYRYSRPPPSAGSSVITQMKPSPYATSAPSPRTPMRLVMAPLPGSMRSSGPEKSRTQSDPAPDVMATG